jgi:hypothetical protein
MTRHLAAFYQSLTSPTLATVNAVPDTQIVTLGNAIRVPLDIFNLSMVASLYEATTFTQAQVETPSLRALAPLDVNPLNISQPLPLNNNFADFYNSPVKLVGNENLTLSFSGTSTGGQGAYGVVEFTDGPIKPVSGNIFTIKASAAATLSAGTFVNSALTLDVVLPAGSYNVVGLRVESANGVAARLAFIGQTYRPGVLCKASPQQQDDMRYRQGNCGSYGVFDQTQTPSIDVLGDTDTAQVVYLDLIKVK